MEQDFNNLIGLKGKPRLSLYLKNDPKFIASSLAAFLQTARKMLSTAPLTNEAINHLMAPMETLKGSLPTDWNGKSFAVFRDETRFTIFPLISSVPPRLVVASSFHVKPLIASEGRAKRGDLIYLDRGNASLHHMFHGRSKPVGEWRIGGAIPHYVGQHLQECPGPVVVFGEEAIPKLPLGARRVIIHQASGSLPFALNTFWELAMKDDEERLMREIDMVMGNPERIVASTASELASRLEERRLRKLFITLEDMAWGEWDESAGVLSVHRCQSNHRDDDLFDDIAEAQILRGTTVRVIPRRLMPLGAAAIAI